MMIFVNGTGVKFGGVNDTSIIEGHVCNYLLIFFKIKHLYCIFSDYINNTHSFEKYSHNAKKYKEESRNHLECRHSKMASIKIW